MDLHNHFSGTKSYFHNFLRFLNPVFKTWGFQFSNFWTNSGYLKDKKLKTWNTSNFIKETFKNESKRKTRKKDPRSNVSQATAMIVCWHSAQNLHFTSNGQAESPLCQKNGAIFLRGLSHRSKNSCAKSPLWRASLCLVSLLFVGFCSKPISEKLSSKP